MIDLETIYALGLDEVLFGDDEGNLPEPTDSDREALAAVAASSLGSDSGGASVWLGLWALIRSLG